MGKHIDTRPDDSYQRGGFKITILRSTIYFYLNEGVVPFAKRNCGDDTSAIMWYNMIVDVIRKIGRDEKKSLWDRLKGFYIGLKRWID